VLPSGDEPVSAASTLVLPSGDEPVSAASTLVLPSGDASSDGGDEPLLSSAAPSSTEASRNSSDVGTSALLNELRPSTQSEPTPSRRSLSSASSKPSRSSTPRSRRYSDGDESGCGDADRSCGDGEPSCGNGGDGPVVSPDDVAIDCAVDDSNDGGESQRPNDDLNDELSDGLSDGLGAVPSTCVADDALRLSTVASCTGFGRQQRTTVSELIGCGHSKSISASASSAAMAASSCGDETVANVGFGDIGDAAEWSSIVPGASSRVDRWIEPPAAM
jgi:hypothetical protein